MAVSVQHIRSESIIIQSPTSFVGSARRIWKLTRIDPPALKLLTVPTAVALILCAWVFCAMWLWLFGLLLVPWRLLRRGQRRRKQENLRHREVLGSVEWNAAVTQAHLQQSTAALAHLQAAAVYQPPLAPAAPMASQLPPPPAAYQIAAPHPTVAAVD